MCGTFQLELLVRLENVHQRAPRRQCVYVVKFYHFHVSIASEEYHSWLTHATRKKNSKLECKLDCDENFNARTQVHSRLAKIKLERMAEAVGRVLGHCESCPANTILVEDQCVQCAAGEMINSTSGVCSNCPAGKFQNAIAHTAEECMSCRSGHYCLEAASEEIVCSGIQVCPENSKYPSSCCDENSEPDATQASGHCTAGDLALPMSFGGTSMGTEYIQIGRVRLLRVERYNVECDADMSRMSRKLIAVFQDQH